MKAFLFSFLLLLALIATTKPAAAQYAATHSIVNPTMENGEFSFEVWSISTGTTSDLRVGFFTYAFTYSGGVLPEPAISNVNPKFTAGSPSGSYLTYNSADYGTSFVVNLIYDQGPGDLLPTSVAEGEMMFKVTFTIANEYPSLSVAWDQDNSGFATTTSDEIASTYEGDIQNMPLPVTLTSFSATARPDGSVGLKWTTAMEVNNKEFTLQRSADAAHFTDVATIPGAGNSTQPLAYAYQDLFPLAGTSYYRLKQQDFDGTTSYHQVVAVKTEGNTQPFITVVSAQPNPFRDRTAINFRLQADAQVILTLVDQMGNTVQTAEINGLAGDNAYSFAGDQLSEGIYFLHMTSASGSTTFKLVKGL